MDPCFELIKKTEKKSWKKIKKPSNDLMSCSHCTYVKERWIEPFAKPRQIELRKIASFLTYDGRILVDVSTLTLPPSEEDAISQESPSHVSSDEGVETSDERKDDEDDDDNDDELQKYICKCSCFDRCYYMKDEAPTEPATMPPKLKEKKKCQETKLLELMFASGNVDIGKSVSGVIISKNGLDHDPNAALDCTRKLYAKNILTGVRVLDKPLLFTNELKTFPDDLDENSITESDSLTTHQDSVDVKESLTSQIPQILAGETTNLLDRLQRYKLLGVHFAYLPLQITVDDNWESQRLMFMSAASQVANLAMTCQLARLVPIVEIRLNIKPYQEEEKSIKSYASQPSRSTSQQQTDRTDKNLSKNNNNEIIIDKNLSKNNNLTTNGNNTNAELKSALPFQMNQQQHSRSNQNNNNDEEDDDSTTASSTSLSSKGETDATPNPNQTTDTEVSITEELVGSTTERDQPSVNVESNMTKTPVTVLSEVVVEKPLSQSNQLAEAEPGKDKGLIVSNQDELHQVSTLSQHEHLVISDQDTLHQSASQQEHSITSDRSQLQQAASQQDHSINSDQGELHQNAKLGQKEHFKSDEKVALPSASVSASPFFDDPTNKGKQKSAEKFSVVEPVSERYCQIADDVLVELMRTFAVYHVYLEGVLLSLKVNLNAAGGDKERVLESVAGNFVGTLYQRIPPAMQGIFIVPNEPLQEGLELLSFMNRTKRVLPWAVSCCLGGGDLQKMVDLFAWIDEVSDGVSLQLSIFAKNVTMAVKGQSMPPLKILTYKEVLELKTPPSAPPKAPPLSAEGNIFWGEGGKDTGDNGDSSVALDAEKETTTVGIKDDSKPLSTSGISQSDISRTEITATNTSGELGSKLVENAKKNSLASGSVVVLDTEII